MSNELKDIRVEFTNVSIALIRLRDSDLNIRGRAKEKDAELWELFLYTYIRLSGDEIDMYNELSTTRSNWWYALHSTKVEVEKEKAFCNSLCDIQKVFKFNSCRNKKLTYFLSKAKDISDCLRLTRYSIDEHYKKELKRRCELIAMYKKYLSALKVDVDSGQEILLCFDKLCKEADGVRLATELLKVEMFS